MCFINYLKHNAYQNKTKNKWNQKMITIGLELDIVIHAYDMEGLYRKIWSECTEKYGVYRKYGVVLQKILKVP